MTTTTTGHVGVVGAGIVGLAVARRLQLGRPGVGVTVWDKEPEVGMHQTGHNSGVVHAGLYETPGSLRAEMTLRGARLLREFCSEHAITIDPLGKLVIAASVDERPALLGILEQARRNGVPDVRLLEGTGIGEIEPYAAGVAAVHSPHTAVVDFRAVAAALAAEVVAEGGTLQLGCAVRAFDERGDRVMLRTAAGPARVDLLVVCAGLGTDTIKPRRRSDVRVLALRGEYRRLAEPIRDRVKGLIYPVPDPAHPFLGIHFTRTHGGEVLVGPNAVPALSLEGYRRRDIDPRFLARVALWPGTPALVREHWRTGFHELSSSLSKASYAAAARRYLPSLRTHDLLPAPAGVRAQAVARDGRLADDFVFDVSGRVAVVRNVPASAATSSLAIAEHIVGRLTGPSR